VGFFSSIPDPPSRDEVDKMKAKGKVPHTQCQGRGKRSVGGNIIDCDGCRGKGFV
jgi:hypothetical protein